jgi:CheY-like chemotaxis protein
MILAAVDDLMFTSKISAAAKGVGTEIVFVRSPDELIAKARASTPRLIIFDLNSRKLQPTDIIARLKADPTLASIHTLGFVSHVDSAAIAQARSAGIDAVLARSAFSARLPEILAGAGE